MPKYLVSKKRKSAYHRTVTIYDFFETYTGSESREKFISTLEDFFTELVQSLIIEKKYVFRMPHGMPPLRIQKKKVILDKLRVDWESTKKNDRKMYHLNKHSDGYFFKFFWDKRSGTRTGGNIYKFYPNREHRHYLSHYIKKCASDPYLRDYDCQR
jgi:hypothetical protein